MTWPPATHQDVKDQIDLKLAITDASATYQPAINPLASAYGGVGDGVTDDTSALNSAISAAQTAKAPLFLPPGKTFKVTSDISLYSGAQVLAHGATLDLQTDHSATGRRLLLNNLTGVKVCGLTLTCTNVTARNQVYGLVTVLSGSNILLEDVVVTAGEGAGIFTGTPSATTATGVSNLRIVRPIVTGVKADGIHISRGASDVWVVDAKVSGTGDDAIAVNSVQTDDGTHNYNQCQRIHIINPSVGSNVTIGSGVAIYGGKDCRLVGGTADSCPVNGVTVNTLSGGAGLTTHTATNNDIQGFHARACNEGLYVGIATDTNVVGVTGVANADCGAQFVSATRTFATGCKFTGSVFGIYASGGASNRILTSDLHGNSSAASNVDANTVVDATCVIA